MMNENLKQLRIEKGLTQLETAQKIGIAETSYQRIEYGLRRGSYTTLKKLAQLFNTTVDKLLA